MTNKQFGSILPTKLALALCTALICCQPVQASSGFGLTDPYEDESDPSISFNSAFLDTIPLNQRLGDFLHQTTDNPFDLKDPSIVQQKVTYDPITGQYILTETIGENNYRNPTYLTFEEYLAWQAKTQEQAYFNSLTGVRNDFITYNNIEDPIEQFDIKNDLIDRLFGGNGITVEPKGGIDITLGGNYQKILNPNLPQRSQRTFRPDFDMDINMGLNAKIGEKLDLNFDYNTNATFSFENKFKLKFDSEAFSEDDIIKNIEAGDVSLPLNSSLIQGNQSLFGLKTELQFGRLYLTTVISQQRSEQESVTIKNGAQWQEFEIKADQYDENRHFLLSHYNRATFSEALEELPQIHSLFRITRAEVWVTSNNNQFEDLREVVGISDLGEYDVFTSPTFDKQKLGSVPPLLWDKNMENVLPDNNANKFYGALLTLGGEGRKVSNVTNVFTMDFHMVEQDFERRRARKLPPSRYTLIPELGVLSLDAQLRPNEMLAVAYEYTYNGKNYQVGEFSADVPTFSADSSGQVLYLKMLKSTQQPVEVPNYDLMMKNFYSIGAYQASEEDFNFDIYYDDPGFGYRRFLPEEGFNTPLLSVYNLDNLNFYGDPASDGFFDFIPGITINTRTGKVMFPVLEPFGEDLRTGLNRLSTGVLPDAIYDKYEYEELYRESIVEARELQEKNRFVLRGSFKSSVSSEISLGSFNLPPNSVTVRSGGVTLRENIDYVVDYQIGRVRIINDAYLASGAPITASFEDRTLFGLNRQSMLGLRADYKVSKKINVGGTFMKLWERPFTEKVNYGDDPINNNIYGLDFAYSNEAPWLTKMVDGIPFLSTKEKSHIDFYLEGAILKPGHSKAINVGGDDGGVQYIDDFEGTSTGILLGSQVNKWSLASVPQKQIAEWPEGELHDTLLIGANRALLNWYRIENNVPRDPNDPYQKTYRQSDIFAGVDFTNNFSDFRTFDLSYHPSKIGPYNFDLPGGYPGISAGLTGCDSENDEIVLANPETRWAGVMREIDATNFEASNVHAMEFWLLNPFINTDAGNNGKFIIQIGSVSEDILKDGLAFYENALPVDGNSIPTDETNLGQIPSLPPVIFAFSNDNTDRMLQDVGLDGYNDLEEQTKFADYQNELASVFPVSCITSSFADPKTGSLDIAHDNYVWFDDAFYDANGSNLFERYSKYNGLEGNSPVVDNSLRFSNSFTSTPDSEDINEDGSSEQNESYYQYEVILNNLDNQLDESNISIQKYLTDQVQSNSADDKEIWYRFKIPLNEHDDKKGTINDFRSIKFVRLITKDFEEDVVLRFAKMEFTRNQWRKVKRIISQPENETCEGTPGPFDVNVVNVEENGAREPFQYVLPPGIDREENFQSAFRGSVLNEQSLSFELCNHTRGCGVRGAYKILNLNIREFERLKLFAHAESEVMDDGDLNFVIRLGSDYVSNYYEFRFPLDFSNLADGDVFNNADSIWKEQNRMDLLLQELKDLKLNRTGPPNQLTSEAYENGVISVIGNPNLGDVHTVFLGVEVDSSFIEPEYCTEVWINELRLVGLNEQGGAAALGRLDMQLADFGNIALTGNISGVGWGSIDKKLLERQQEKIVAYDAATNLELGKFFGEKSGIKIPFFAQYSNNTSTPKYDPYDRDITVDEKIAKDPSQASTIRDNAQDKTAITTVSFNNVRKERSTKKKIVLPWDVSNFAVSYTNTKTKHSDPILSQDDSKQQTGSLDYKFTTGSKPIEPFKKLIKKGKWLKFIKDINFNPLPSSISIRNTLDRREKNRQFRTITDGTENIPEQALSTSRQFTWNRDYRVSWNFTKSIKFNYFATNQSAVDELDNDGFELFQDPLTGDQRFVGNDRRDEYLWDNLKGFGRNKSFDQSFDISYKMPFSKFGLLDWITADLSYKGNYNWTAASLNNEELGHSISNGNNGSARINMNLEKLYNKSKFLATINKGKSTTNRKKRSQNDKGTPTDKGGKTGKSGGKKKVPTVAKIFLRPLMAVRRVRFNYTETNSSFVPGINRSPEFLGLSSGFDAPGWEYIGGFTPNNEWFENNSNDATPSNRYFVNHDCVSQEFARNYTENWDAQLSVEPVRDFKIDFKIERQFSRSESSLFKFREGDFGFGDWSEFGSYTITYLTTKTLFRDGEDNINALFGTFKENLQVISQRVNAASEIPTTPLHPDYPGQHYADGYGPTHQQVIIPAFLAAYRDKSATVVKLNAFDATPLPNWTLTYNGLTKIPWFKERFSKFSLSHTYNSTLTINSFNTDLRFNQIEEPTDTFSRNPITQDFYSRLTIPQVVIAEGMTPIIKLDITTVNDMSISFEVGKNRTLSLDPDNQQINETRGSSWTAGFGYTLKNVYLGFIPGAKKQKPKRPNSRPGANTKGTKGKSTFEGNTLKINCDFSIRDDRTIQHLWGLDVSARPTRGQKAVTISPSIDYAVNKNLSMRAFVDYRSTKPYTELSYPVTNIRGGLRLSFTLK